MALLEGILETYNIDRARILVTGFSLGGRGTWFFATRHPDFFTGAIPIAGRPGDEPLDALGDHAGAHHPQPRGRRRSVRPRRGGGAADRGEAGGTVAFTALDRVGHYAMGGYVRSLRDGRRVDDGAVEQALSRRDAQPKGTGWL